MEIDLQTLEQAKSNLLRTLAQRYKTMAKSPTSADKVAAQIFDCYNLLNHLDSEITKAKKPAKAAKAAPAAE